MIQPPRSSFLGLGSFLKQANLVCIVGFGYHEVNIARLRLTSEVRGNIPIVPSTYHMGNAEMRVPYGRISHPSLRILSADNPWREFKAERFLREVAQIV